MQIETTGIDGLLVMQPAVHGDDRGYFMETYNARNLTHADLHYEWVQDNEAQSSRGVLRGLHLQQGEHAQAKLVRVITGAVLDVAVDLRPDSKTYGRAFTVELTGSNKLQLLVPRGFAHGYLSLEDDTIFSYKVDNYYCREAEAGLRYDDPSLGIDWGIEAEGLLIADRDLNFPLLTEIDAGSLW
jgi:dTDP-4-dehydrorhamnose 3,5-epimerase